MLTDFCVSVSFCYILVDHALLADIPWLCTTADVLGLLLLIFISFAGLRPRLWLLTGLHVTFRQMIDLKQTLREDGIGKQTSSTLHRLTTLYT